MIMEEGGGEWRDRGGGVLVCGGVWRCCSEVWRWCVEVQSLEHRVDQGLDLEFGGGFVFSGHLFQKERRGLRDPSLSLKHTYKVNICTMTVSTITNFFTDLLDHSSRQVPPGTVT